MDWRTTNLGEIVAMPEKRQSGVAGFIKTGWPKSKSKNDVFKHTYVILRYRLIASFSKRIEQEMRYER